MSDETVRLSMVGRIVRTRWRLLVAFAVLGGLVGAGASVLFSPGYQTSSSVLLQGPREENELLTEAQIAMSSVVLDRAAADLGQQVSGSELRDLVSAEVADGNVIQITGTGDTPEQAQQVADRVAEEYVAYATQLVSDIDDPSTQVLQEQRDALRQQVAQTNQRITDLHESATRGVTVDSIQVRTDLEALRTALNEAMLSLAEAETASSRANMVIMGPAQRPTGPAAPSMTHLVAGGIGLAVLLGLLGHLIAARTDRRLRTDSEIAAALGTSVLTGIDVPDEPNLADQEPDSGYWRAWSRRLLGDGTPWDLPPRAVVDEPDKDVRYRRVLARLRAGSGPRLRALVLVTEGDRTALEATARLAVAAAATDGGTVSVVTDRTDLAQLVRRTAADTGCRNLLTVRSTAEHEPAGDHTLLRVVVVDPARPSVPDDLVDCPALVVLTAGTRTAWDLVGVAEACATAEQQLTGVVVTHRARAAGAEPHLSSGTPVRTETVDDELLADAP